MMSVFPVIDLPATGANILRLRQTRGLSVRDLQRYFGFEEPQAIYKWQRGQSLRPQRPAGGAHERDSGPPKALRLY